MKIGIDIDEVLVEYLAGVINFYNFENKTYIKKEQFNSYNFWEVWGGTREEAIQICDNFYNSEGFNQLMPVQEALDSVNNLHKNNELFLITARPLHWKEKTERWIKENITFNPNTIFSSDFHSKQGKTRLSICKEFGISLLLDDNAHYALECANSGIKVILFDKPWNKKAEHPNITRVKNWPEALKKIEHLKNQ